MMMTEILDIFQSDLRPMQYWHVRAMEMLDKWASGIPEGYSTGFKDLDEHTRLIAGELMVIAARPSMGKTAIAMQMAESTARAMQTEGDPGVVAVFSAEMPGQSLFIRMAGALAGINTHTLRTGKGSLDDLSEMRWAMEQLRTLPIWIDDNSGPTTRQMLEQLSELNATMPVRMMLFDFVELGGDRAQKEDLRIAAIAQNLKAIAKTLNIPVIALSQLNREVEARANKMPQLSDLRYSGTLEQVADSVLFITRPEYYLERGQTLDVPKEDRKGVAYLQVAKNRNGPVGLVRLAFLKDKVKFGNLQRG
jgi:replicative DNA helicase